MYGLHKRGQMILKSEQVRAEEVLSMIQIGPDPPPRVQTHMRLKTAPSRMRKEKPNQSFSNFIVHFRDADKATSLVSSVRSADASLTCTRLCRLQDGAGTRSLLASPSFPTTSPPLAVSNIGSTDSQVGESNAFFRNWHRMTCT